MKQPIQLLQHLESPTGEERFLVSGERQGYRRGPPQKPRVKGRGKSTISLTAAEKDSTVLWLPPPIFHL